MNIRVSLNEKHESYQITAFLQQLYCYEHKVELVYTKGDLLDQDLPPSMDNIPLPKHHIEYVDRVVFEDGKRTTVLYERPVNTSGVLRRKAHV